MNSTVSFNDFLKESSKFVIPFYQRGYVWGKSRGNEELDSVSYMLKSIYSAYEEYLSNKNKTLFLQGITITKDEEGSIVLVDGQQRATFYYLLLKYLNGNVDYKLLYKVRRESEEFLTNLEKIQVNSKLVEYCKEEDEEEFQDIYYFKKTIRIVDDFFKAHKYEAKELIKFLLNNVKFLRIEVEPDKAITTFSMMNGSKAIMKQEELIKAELLRVVSFNKTESEQIDKNDIKKTEEKLSEVWEQNLLRSRYAREWDRWLYWWNRPEVQSFYYVKDIPSDEKNESNSMGWLLQTYFFKICRDSKKTDISYNFNNFRDYVLNSDVDKTEEEKIKRSKDVFYDLRHIQKKFEDVFNDISGEFKLHNKIAAIICLSKANDRKDFIYSYFGNAGEIKDEDINTYYLIKFLNMSHKNIISYLKDNSRDSEYSVNVKDQIGNMLSLMKESFLYRSEKEQLNLVFNQLLRLNIEEDLKLNRSFDFAFWNGNRSLEHIFPKSKIYFEQDGKFYKSGDSDTQISEKEYKAMKADKDCMSRECLQKLNGITEHCIGNLVLLHKNDNSSFNNNNFESKKKIYFDYSSQKVFESRHLLHTVSIFANSIWSADQIKQNYDKINKDIEETYGRIR